MRCCYFRSLATMGPRPCLRRQTEGRLQQLLAVVFEMDPYWQSSLVPAWPSISVLLLPLGLPLDVHLQSLELA